MKAIFKYLLEEKELSIIEMPKGSEILCVQLQNDKPCIWALVDEEKELGNRFIELFVTGHPITELHNRKYIGTCQLLEGRLVFHCFERLIS